MGCAGFYKMDVLMRTIASVLILNALLCMCVERYLTLLLNLNMKERITPQSKIYGLYQLQT